ncbi:hypothetical protein WMY93_026677 [Mugilogobius chulae]|uniref:Apple domain-containing protein n=1 Tax=Mugilogobius chulae TaxID=88201 RepID=A0AAW0MY72_9GOBI
MEQTLALILICICAALCQGCDQGLRENVTFSGSANRLRFSPSARHCQLMCTQDPECERFTFNGRYCYLWRNGTFTQTFRAEIISGYNLRGCPQAKKLCLNEVFEGVTFFNKPYLSVKTDSHEECREKCLQDQQCQFYTFYLPSWRKRATAVLRGAFGNKNKSSTYELKFSMPIPTPFFKPLDNVFGGFSNNFDVDFGSGEVCPSQLEVDMQLEDGRYNIKFSAISVDHCQALYNINPECYVFMYIRDFKKKLNCLMKSDSGVHPEKTGIKIPGVTSGRAQKGCKVDFSAYK